MKNEAIRAARQQSLHGPQFGTGECLQRVRECYGIPSDGTPTAIEAWQRAKKKHPTQKLREIPRGVPIFWSGGSHGFGHVSISCGMRSGRTWSTDILRNGFFDHVLIRNIHEKWGLDFLGWAEDLDGKPVPWHPLLPRHKHK